MTTTAQSCIQYYSKELTPLLRQINPIPAAVLDYAKMIGLITHAPNYPVLVNKMLQELVEFDTTVENAIHTNRAITLLQEMQYPIRSVPADHTKLCGGLLELHKTILKYPEYGHLLDKMKGHIPSTSNQFVSYVKNNTICIQYNRLLRCSDELDMIELDEDGCVMRAEINACFSKMVEVLVVIPDDYETFMERWREKAFDTRPESELLPRQMMYRSYNCDGRPDNWLFRHSNQLQHMRPNEFWMKSPMYTNLFGAVQFAFCHYELFEPFNPSELPPLPNEPIPDRKWNLTNSPLLTERMAPQNAEFQTYYSEIVKDFCKMAEESHDTRTGSLIDALFLQGTRIRVMTEIMLNGPVIPEDNGQLNCWVQICIPFHEAPDRPLLLWELIDNFANAIYEKKETDDEKWKQLIIAELDSNLNKPNTSI